MKDDRQSENAGKRESGPSRTYSRFRLFTYLSAALVVACSGAMLHARVSSSAAPSPVPVLVELFTSEGCSSCPPADQVLADLASMQAAPGAMVIGLGEHVDYWDQLGWVDPFSSAQFTARQSAYLPAFAASGNYTPQMIVDGHEECVGSDRAHAVAAITRAAAVPNKPVNLSWKSPGALDISIPALAKAPKADVWLAITEDGLVSDVKHGENAGHTLRHWAVTRQLTRLGESQSDGGFARTMAIPLDRTWKSEAINVVVFMQAKGPGRVLGAETIKLPR